MKTILIAIIFVASFSVGCSGDKNCITCDSPSHTPITQCEEDFNPDDFGGISFDAYIEGFRTSYENAGGGCN